MTEFKKVTAVLLSLLMAFSVFSVLGAAVDDDPDTGYAIIREDPAVVSINVKFADSEDNELDNLSVVSPGDTLKARVYPGTNYYSCSGDITFYYDDFFDTDYIINSPVTLTVNTANSTASATGMSVRAVKSSDGVLRVSTHTASNIEKVFQYDDSTWLFEFNVTVKADATGNGSLWADEGDLCSPDNDGPIDIPYAWEGDDVSEVYPLWIAQVTAEFSANAVTTDNVVVFDANGGYFGNASVTEQEVPGTVGQTYNIPADPERDGYTFNGWTLEGAPVFEGETTFEMPADTGVEYVANWIKQVTIHFDNTGDSTVN
ncbi:MAG: InlB B-repeat-containing protein, partial [Clostridia bacterium]|nr:InlB B-repeat-containing protein [Clostridia bacterium]